MARAQGPHDSRKAHLGEGSGRTTLRRILMFEPRGHLDMYGALLTEPERPDSHAGVLFMHNEGFSTMCGHGIIAVATIAFERGLITPAGGGSSLVLDAPRRSDSRDRCD
jgi:proline racemase